MNYDTFRKLDKIALNLARIQQPKPLPDMLGLKVPPAANAGQQQMAQQKQPMQPKQPQTFMDFASDTLNTVKGVFSQVAKMQNPNQQVAQKQMPGAAPAAANAPAAEVVPGLPKQSSVHKLASPYNALGLLNAMKMFAKKAPKAVEKLPTPPIVLKEKALQRGDLVRSLWEKSFIGHNNPVARKDLWKYTGYDLNTKAFKKYPWLIPHIDKMYQKGRASEWFWNKYIKAEDRISNNNAVIKNLIERYHMDKNHPTIQNLKLQNASAAKTMAQREAQSMRLAKQVGELQRSIPLDATENAIPRRYWTNFLNYKG